MMMTVGGGVDDGYSDDYGYDDICRWRELLMFHTENRINGKNIWLVITF